MKGEVRELTSEERSKVIEELQLRGWDESEIVDIRAQSGYIRTYLRHTKQHGRRLEIGARIAYKGELGTLRAYRSILVSDWWTPGVTMFSEGYYEIELDNGKVLTRVPNSKLERA